jgi:hypothetical protein
VPAAPRSAPILAVLRLLALIQDEELGELDVVRAAAGAQHARRERRPHHAGSMRLDTQRA